MLPDPQDLCPECGSVPIDCICTEQASRELLETTKYDQGKPEAGLLPSGPLEDVIRVLEHGAKKYDQWNWAKGTNYGRFIGALWRHVFRDWWFHRQDNDPESTRNHLAHGVCCLLFLLYYQQHNLGEDDRPVLPHHGDDKGHS